jgi:hypothetical protein
MLPDWNVILAVAEGPFEDDLGCSSHLDKAALSGWPASKRIGALKVDVHTSVVKLARNVQMHSARLLYGEGQGAIIAAGYAKPALLEQALATRNVQTKEACQLGQSWGNISGVLITAPRISRKSIGVEDLRIACPEFFDNNCPVESRRTYGLRNYKSTFYVEEKDFYMQADVEIVDGLAGAPVRQLLEATHHLMWEHDGKCACGRRTYLFGQCLNCLAEDRSLKQEQQEREARDLAEEETAPVSSLGPAISAGANVRAVIFVTDDDVLQAGKQGAWMCQKSTATSPQKQ